MVCVLLAGYMTFRESLRYLENSDTSSIGFKEFAKTPKDTYPTFSFCITDHQESEDSGIGLIYHYYKKDIENTLQEFGHGGYMEFAKALKGRKTSILKYPDFSDINANWNESVNYDMRNISLSQFNSYTIDLKELVNMVEFGTEDINDRIEIDVDQLRINSNLPFYVSYQDPETICFTRKSDDKENIIRIYDLFSLITKQLDRFHPLVVFKIYLHHPGQLLRSFGSPVIQYTKQQFSRMKKTEFTIKVSQVTILRKREDANIPCNTTLHDDDLQLMKEITKRVGCIPIYWNKIMPLNYNYKLCKSAEEMTTIDRYLQDLNEIQSHYLHPCNEMQVSTILEKDMSRQQGSSLIITTIRYMDKFYEEIINERDFGFESFWSAVGGFIGIFVGASLSQVPILMAAAWNFLQGLKKQ